MNNIDEDSESISFVIQQSQNEPQNGISNLNGRSVKKLPLTNRGAIGRFLLAPIVFPGSTLSGRRIKKKSLEKHSTSLDILRRDLEETFNGERVTLNTSDGIELDGMYFPPREKFLNGNPTAILCQGNFVCYEESQDLIKLYQELNISVMVFNYRGYGESQHASTGSSAEGAVCDAEAAIAYVRERTEGITNNNILVHGMSIGGGVAVCLTAQQQNKGVHLIVDQTFAKFEDVGADLTRRKKKDCEGLVSKVARVVMRELYGFDSEETIKEVTGEVCVIRSLNDNMMREGKYNHAKRLYDARYPEGAKDEEGNDCSDLHRIEKSGGHLRMNYSGILDDLLQFLYVSILK